MNIAIVAGGNLEKAFLPDIQRADFIVGVDRGAAWLLKYHVTSDIAIGDFDSVSAKELKAIEKSAGRIEKYPSAKDKTDLELAIGESIKFKPREITLFGAIGTRFDQSISAIGLLLKLESHNINGQIVDNFNKIYIVRHRKVIKKSFFKYVSVIPVNDQLEVTLSGFVYNGARLAISSGSTRGISNEIARKESVIEVHKGTALVIESRD